MWFRLVDEALVTADKRAYQSAVRYPKAAKKAATAADAMVELEVRVASLRETHRQREPAEGVGTTQSAIPRLEGGNIPPSLPMLARSPRRSTPS